MKSPKASTCQSTIVTRSPWLSKSCLMRSRDSHWSLKAQSTSKLSTTRALIRQSNLTSTRRMATVKELSQSKRQLTARRRQESSFSILQPVLAIRASWITRLLRTTSTMTENFSCNQETYSLSTRKQADSATDSITSMSQQSQTTFALEKAL